MKPHQLINYRRKKRSTVCGCPWPVCSRCGLVLLNNEVSRRAAKRECEGPNKYEGVHVYRKLNLG